MPQELYHELVARLSHLRQKQERVALLSGLGTGLAAVVVVALAAILAEVFGHFTIAGRTWLFYSALVIALTGLFGFLLPPLLTKLGLRARPTDDELASRIGRHYPQVSDRLVNSLQLT